MTTKSMRPPPSWSGKCPETIHEAAIHEAVVRLLQETRSTDERRWVPRAQYVRPAWAHFKQRRDPNGEKGRTVLVATTDLSFEGAGVLSWQEIPARHLLLQLSGVCFACNVRWRSVLADQIYRYGLHFYKVLDKPVPGESFVADSNNWTTG